MGVVTNFLDRLSDQVHRSTLLGSGSRIHCYRSQYLMRGGAIVTAFTGLAMIY